MPWVEVDKDYEFEGPDGTVSLARPVRRAPSADRVPRVPRARCARLARARLRRLLDGRRPGRPRRAPATPGTPPSRSPPARPQADIERVKARMGWEMPWYTMTDGFDADFGVDEWHGTNAFIRDGDRVFRTYFIYGRGDEALGSTWSYLDMTAARPPGGVGGLARGLPPDAAVRVVGVARRGGRARRGTPRPAAAAHRPGDREPRGWRRDRPCRRRARRGGPVAARERRQRRAAARRRVGRHPHAAAPPLNGRRPSRRMGSSPHRVAHEMGEPPDADATPRTRKIVVAPLEGER